MTEDAVPTPLARRVIAILLLIFLLATPQTATAQTAAAPAADDSNRAPEAEGKDASAAQQPAEVTPQAEAEQFISTLNDTKSDDRARRVAAVRLKNSGGEALPALEKAAARQDLSPEARSAVDDALPMVQYRAKRDRLAGEVHANDLKSMLESYEAHGRKDPTWDDLVRQAIKAGQSDRVECIALFKKALDAGCTDPFVQYLYARNALLAGRGKRDDLVHLHLKAALALAETTYPAEWKCRAAARYIESTGDADLELVDQSLKHLPQALAETKRDSEDVYALANLVFRVASQTRGAEAAFEEVHKAYAAARPADDPGPHVFKGVWYKDWAWEARGGGYAHTVTEEGWALFRQRLSVAKKSLQAAWKADPTDPRAPTQMIPVIMGQSGSKPEMEMWFTRAMQNNPDNRVACGFTLYFLYPRWHGSHREMVAFGRECFETQNWWGPLPTILPDAHRQVATESNDPKAYYRQPAVWKDVEAVHKSFLEAFPTSPNVAWHRNRLAKWACDCEHWDEAVRQFDRIGDDIDRNVFPSKAVYDYYRRKAQNRANKVQEVRAF
jgi:hypothetical protein